jgi:transposase
MISIGDADRRLLEHWMRSPTTPQRLALRSRMLLLALDGLTHHQIADECGVSPATVKLWMTRVQREGILTLQHDAPGRGRHSALDPTFRDRLREANLLDAAGQPVSLRRAAAFLGVSASALWRALKKEAGLGPGRTRPPVNQWSR